MTKPFSVNGPVALKNVAAFMVMTQRLIDRDPHLPGIGVCSSPSGYGKSYAAIYAQNKTRAIRVEIGDSWTRRSLLKAILGELQIKPRGQLTVSDMANEAIAALGEEPSRPLIVDEADKAVDKGFIELVRELHEHSGVPVILIGEEKLPGKLLAVERVHNRVLDWMPAQPCDLEDTQELAKAFAPKLEIADDLLELICQQSGGRARRIVVNVSRIGEAARNKGLKTIDLAKWGNGALFTGEPPLPRHIEQFKRTRPVTA
ncbi:MAG: AAA family ATPase [Rhodopseudomonas sp.]|nr:AAA family ATPase [Rhodopseudomonas sp.]